MLITEYLQCRKQLNITGIYKITNKINHLIYIGQAKNINRRIANHITSSTNILKKDYDYPLHKAFRKYGLDNFELDVVEQCSCTELNSREIYWISFYNSKAAGYNQTAGGNQSIRFIKLTDDNIMDIRSALNDNKLTNKELAEKFNVSIDTIQKINTGRAWFDSSICYPIRKVSKEHSYHFNGSCVEQIDLATNNIIAKFISISAAAKAIGNYNKSAQICRCCNNERKSAYGFGWRLATISYDDWLKLF